MGSKAGFLVGIFVSFSLSSIAVATAPKCGDLVEDLRAMQAAQKQLLQSYAQKNETMATVLDQNAKKLEKTMSTRRVIKKSDLKALHVSARAFRGHQHRENALIERFEKASDELLNQVQACLANSGELAKLD